MAQSTQSFRRAAAIAAAIFALPAAAAADARLTARYSVHLELLPISFATGTLKATIPDRGRYNVDLGVRGSAISFSINAKATGNILGGELVPLNAVINAHEADDERRVIRMALARGRVRSESVEPPLPDRHDRVPITSEHRRGVTDPVSAMIMPIEGKREPLDGANCNRRLSIYEGTERFDLRMSFLRVEEVESRTGYRGKVLVCRADYVPIAGHREGSSQVKFMRNNRIEAWLAPVEGTRMLAPWKISLRTILGVAAIQATDFNVSQGKTAALDGEDDPELTGTVN